HAIDSERECANASALHEGATSDVDHVVLPDQRFERAASVAGTKAGSVSWNGWKIQRRIRIRIKQRRACQPVGTVELLDLAAEQPLGIAVSDAACLVVGQLREPGTIGLHGVVVARPAL